LKTKSHCSEGTLVALKFPKFIF